MHPNNELQAYEILLCGHLTSFIRRLRQLSPEQWDWTPDPAAPSARTVAVHAWQWLFCDRQHIAEPDASKHSRVPEPPVDTREFCDVFAEESKNWERLLRSLTADQLDRPSFQFSDADYPYTVRGYICHMIQHVIYKHGQFSELYFAMGLDGTEPYTASFPNSIYAELFPD